MNHTKNIFTNSGIRQTIDHELLQPKAIQALGYAIATLLAQEFDYVCNILIATDTRPSGECIKQTLIDAFIECGHDVFDAGILPTPYVAKALKDFVPDDSDENDDTDDHQDFDDLQDQNNEPFFTLGIIITASHNPANFNGIKILTPFGYLDEVVESEITSLFFEFYNKKELINDAHAQQPGYLQNIHLAPWYQATITEHIKKVASPTTVLLDCAHGAAAQVGPDIFQSFGYQVTPINADTDGSKINQNSNCNNPQLLMETLQKSNATWACAFDGDADRVIIAHRNGTIFDGDDIVAILAQHPRYKNNPIIVGTILTNQGLEQYLKTLNKKLIRCAVGERNLINALIKHQAFLGAETCGHIIMMDHALCSDGIFTALQFLELMQNKNIAHVYKKYDQQHKMIHISDPKKIPQCSSQITALQKQYQIGDSCRIIVRPSNTEPVLRIMVESLDQQKAINICNALHDQLKFLLNN